MGVPASEQTGFVNVPAREIEYFGKQTNFSNKFGIQLLTYGNIDAGVATADGQVIKNVDYVVACYGLRCPARIYYLPKDADLKTVRNYLFGEYGQFSYAGKQKHSFQQTFAQPPQRHTKRSVTYRYAEEKVENFQAKRILDFGAGEAVEANLLKKQGVKITSLEFFPRLRTKRNDCIDTFSCNYDVERLIRFLQDGGLFDVVICDSVLNSVISNQVERDVLTCLNAFCKIGGELLISTRSDTELKSKIERREAFSGKQVGFTTAMPDKDGVTGTMGNHGEWFFQKFHSRDQLRSLCNQYGLEILSFAPNFKVIAYCKKVADLSVEDVRESIYNEFNMFYSDTERYDHADKVWAVLENCYNIVA